MLKVQEFLKTHSIQDLVNKYAIKVTYSEDGRLVILSYNQIESPKRDTITRECRSLCLETESGSWQIVGRSFFRFFNLGEYKEDDKTIDWSNITVEEKCDGSLITLYWFDGEWRINTKSSFGNGEMIGGSGITWKEKFFSILNIHNLDLLSKSHSYIFELCSRFNKVVRTYPEDRIYLLTAVHNNTGQELNEILLDGLAQHLSAHRPERFTLNSLESITKFLSEHSDPTFEGFVIRSGNSRFKQKSSSYVALHNLLSNQNLHNPKNLIPLIIKGEIDEVLCYFPELSEKVFDIVKVIDGEKSKAKIVYQQASKIKGQKEFAQYVIKHTLLSPVCFNARKQNITFEECYQKMAEEFWIKKYEKS